MATTKKPDLSALSLAELRELQTEIRAAITEKEKAEKAALIAEFEARASESGFLLADLFAGTPHAPGGAGTQPKAKKEKATRGVVPPKYRNPENSLETWSGRGRQPVWVRDQIATGKTLDDLAIPAAAE